MHRHRSRLGYLPAKPYGNLIAMEARLRKIGTSKGVIIPKAFIDELALGETIEMTLSNGSLVLKPKRKVREGWGDGPPIEFTDEDRAWLDADLLDPKDDLADWEWN